MAYNNFISQPFYVSGRGLAAKIFSMYLLRLEGKPQFEFPFFSSQEKKKTEKLVETHNSF